MAALRTAISLGQAVSASGRHQTWYHEECEARGKRQFFGLEFAHERRDDVLARLGWSVRKE